MKLNQLRIFLAVYDSLSTAKAAKLVHRTQPSVSSAIASIEQQLNLKLFERSTRGMEPTPAATAFAQRANAAFAHLRAAEAQFTDLGYKAPDLWKNATDLQLRGLSALIHHRNFMLAARALQCSEPSLHRAVSALSQLTRCALWNRIGRGIEPTREAMILAGGIGRCESEVRLGLEAAEEVVGVIRGQLLIGALPTARPAWLPSAVENTLARYPDCRVSVMDGPYEEQIVALRHGRIDMIIGMLRAPAAARDIEQIPVLEDSLSIVVKATHALARDAKNGGRRPNAQQLTALSWLLPPPSTPARECFDAFLQEKGLPPAHCVVECNSLVTIWSLLMASDFAAVIPTSQTRSKLIGDRLTVLGKPVEGSRHAVGLAIRRGFVPTQLQRTFIDALKGTRAALTAG